METRSTRQARELFLRVANLPLPKDVIYIWGDIIENMAVAQQFDLALDIDDAMAAAEGTTTAGNDLATIVEKFIEAKAQPKFARHPAACGVDREELT